jgi:hypothetical protein
LCHIALCCCIKVLSTFENASVGHWRPRVQTYVLFVRIDSGASDRVTISHCLTVPFYDVLFHRDKITHYCGLFFFDTLGCHICSKKCRLHAIDLIASRPAVADAKLDYQYLQFIVYLPTLFPSSRHRLFPSCPRRCCPRPKTSRPLPPCHRSARPTMSAAATNA